MLELMMGVFESAANGRRVELPQSRREHALLRWWAQHGLGASGGAASYETWIRQEDERLGRSSSIQRHDGPAAWSRLFRDLDRADRPGVGVAVHQVALVTS